MTHASTYSAPIAARAQLKRMSWGRPEARVLVVGHAHRASSYGVSAARVARALGEPLRLPRGGRVLINPGSIPQAAERLPCLRCVVLDLLARLATFHAVDVVGARRALQLSGPAPLHSIRLRPRLGARTAKRPRASVPPQSGVRTPEHGR